MICSGLLHSPKVQLSLQKNHNVIITFIAFSAIALLTTGLLGHFKVIKLKVSIQRVLIYTGSSTLLIAIFFAVCCRFKMNLPITSSSQTNKNTLLPKTVLEANANKDLTPSSIQRLPIKLDTTWTLQEAQSPFTDTNQQLTLTSFNLGMLPKYVTQLQRIIGTKNLLDSPRKRIKKIIVKIKPEINTVLSLQELFCNQATTELCKSFPQYNIVHSVGHTSMLCPVNSGLVFATRYPIIKNGIKFYRFTNLAGEDALSAKGILCVPIQIKNEKVLFFSLHLQAKLGPKYTKIRKEQLECALFLIQAEKKQNPNLHIFLMGDFNISDKDLNGTTNEYSNLHNVFECFTDFFTINNDHRNETPGSFIDLSTGEIYKGIHYDYILLLKNAVPENFDSSFAFETWAVDDSSSTCTPPFLSDHRPCIVKLPIDMFR